MIPGGPSAGDFFFPRGQWMRSRAISVGDELRQRSDEVADKRRRLALI